jgi:hypothetical protein
LDARVPRRHMRRRGGAAGAHGDWTALSSG